MDQKEYALIDRVQEKHWWWLGRKMILQTLIESLVDLTEKKLIADVGCGFGANIPFLRQYGDVVGLELNPEAHEKINNKWGSSVEMVLWKSPEKVNYKFDLILMADVLEHIPNDSEAIDWVYEHLREGGYAIFTVPAHQFFWSEMDEVVHHYRRYSYQSFQSLFDSHKFEWIKLSFYNFFLFPIKILFVIVTRLKRYLLPKQEKRSYNDVPPVVVNTIFKYILYFESKLIQFLSLPFGISIVAILKKAQSTSSELTATP